METPNDLVQVDIETALALYVKGYTHIPVLKRDSYSSDWTSFQPLYLDDILEGLMCFASDSKRAELLNPPKVDIAKVKESIYLDDDPDWVEPDEDGEPEPEPDNFEEIPAPDEVKVPSNPFSVTPEDIDSRIRAIEFGEATPAVWNVREAVYLHDKSCVSYNKLGKFYGISDVTVKNRITHYKMK